MNSRLTFERLCELLPAETNWGDNLTPEIVQHIVSALSSAPSAEPANFDASDTNFRSVLVPLYEASILSAAVDAAIERAADEVLNLLDATRHDKYNAAVKEAAEAIRACNPLTDWRRCGSLGYM